MIRRALTLATVAAAGVVTNVLVAWACVLYCPMEHEYDFSGTSVPCDWVIEEPDWYQASGLPAPDYSVANDSARGFGVTRVELVPVIDRGPRGPEYGTVSCLLTIPIAYETSAGWPLPGLRGLELDAMLSPDPDGNGWWLRWGVSVERLPAFVAPSNPSAVLPLRPIWSGFALNSLVYGGAIWLLTVGPRTLRRAARRAAGKCRACGYDLTALGSDRCPECGTTRFPAAGSRSPH